LAEIISKTHKCRFILSLIFILYLLFWIKLSSANLIQETKTSLIFSLLSSWVLYKATDAQLSVKAVIYLFLTSLKTKDSNKIFTDNLSNQLEFS
jgi:hypothetical protein